MNGLHACMGTSCVPPRPLEEIDADLDQVSREIMELLVEVHA